MAARKKKAAAAKKRAAKTKAITPKKVGGAIAAAHDYGEMAGSGYENVSAEFFTIPFLGILQGLSPEVNKADGAHIPGAEVGMLIDSVAKELVLGEDGLVLVPVDVDQQFVEWVPRDKGGGFVATHLPSSAEVAEAKDASTEFGKYKIGDNDLIETFYIHGFILPGGMGDFTAPKMIMVACKSTAIKKFRNLMTRLRSIPGAPLYAHQVLVRTVPEQNPKGAYYNYDFGPAGDDTQSSLIDPADADGLAFMEGCQKFQEQCRSGAARGNYDSVSNNDEAGGDEPF